MSATIDRPRIAIVGAGNIAKLNVAGYLEDERCDVVAVCDPIEGRAAAAAEAWGVPAAYTDLDAMLADPDIDAVEILTPTNLHHDHVLAAARGRQARLVPEAAGQLGDRGPGHGNGRRGSRHHPPGQ